MEWTVNQGRVMALGYIPTFLSEYDERPAKEQIHSAYAHGGGWQPFEGFDMVGFNPDDPMEARITYPGDPPFRSVGWTRLRDEFVLVFHYAWVAIVQKDGTYEIARLD